LTDAPDLDKIPVNVAFAVPMGNGQMTFSTQFMRGEPVGSMIECIDKLESVATRFLMKGQVPLLEENLSKLAAREISEKQSLARASELAQQARTAVEKRNQEDARAQVLSNLAKIAAERDRVTGVLAGLRENLGLLNGAHG
jgi:hypothetical protein